VWRIFAAKGPLFIVKNGPKKWSFWVKKATFRGQKLTINVQNRLKNLPNIVISLFRDHCDHLRWVSWCLAPLYCDFFNIYGRNRSKNGVFGAKNDTFCSPKWSKPAQKPVKDAENIATHHSWTHCDRFCTFVCLSSDFNRVSCTIYGQTWSKMWFFSPKMC